MDAYVTLAELLFGIAALPAGKRKDMLGLALEGLLGLFRDRILSFDTDAARRYAELAAIAASRGFTVASRDTARFAAAGVSVINPWNA